MPTTELVVLSLKPGSEIGEPSNHAAKVLKETCETLSKQDGCEQVHFSSVDEDPSKVRLFIDWKSVEHHKAFMSSDAYDRFKKNIGSTSTAPPKVLHVDFKPTGAFEEVLKAPTTELTTRYFDGGVPNGYLDDVAKSKETMSKAPGFKGMAWGSTYETVEHEGTKGTAAIVAIGWASKDHSTEFSQIQSYKDIESLITSGSKGHQLQHVQAMKFIE